ncbi:hypothetical protein SAMN05444412_103148 [Rhodonellum ikkaensis]|uniref:Uncharacterized protein n=1 Tax=Rhodonellum ikkaensis TaxID=336829 RepID=A0A1H3N921_9BACT|nr:hypothetical protein SAMN05444412_103148 [Rhodonellum ikkaensis]
MAFEEKIFEGHSKWIKINIAYSEFEVNRALEFEKPNFPFKQEVLIPLFSYLTG